MSANGYLTDAERRPVQGSIELLNVTATAWLNMVAYAFSQGVIIAIVLPAGGYRPWSMQLDMRARPSIYNITPGILPGLPSNHGWGTCVDVAGNWRWVVANGARWGFGRPANTLAMGDLNHFLHDGRTTGPTISGAGGIGSNITPGGQAPVTSKGSQTMFIRRATTGSMYLQTDFGRAPFAQPSHVTLFQRMFTTFPNWDDMLEVELDIIDSYTIAAQLNFRNWMQGTQNSQSDYIASKVQAGVDNVNSHGASQTAELTASINALVAKFPAVDSAAISKSIIASLGNIQATVDPSVVAKAVDAILADNFAQVKTEADARQGQVTAALTKVGTIDIPSVVSAVVAGIQKAGTLSEADEVAIAVAVKNAITPDLVRLELKNQLK